MVCAHKLYISDNYTNRISPQEPGGRQVRVRGRSIEDRKCNRQPFYGSGEIGQGVPLKWPCRISSTSFSVSIVIYVEDGIVRSVHRDVPWLPRHKGKNSVKNVSIEGSMDQYLTETSIT